MSIFSEIRERALIGERLAREEALFLLDPKTDLEEVRRIADSMRETFHGNQVCYNVNVHLNPTNVCRLRCPLCAFSCDAEDEKSYVLSEDEIREIADRAVSQGATEIHVVGGIHPDKPYSWYRGILELLHHVCPRLQLKAWTAIEIAHFARDSGKNHEKILRDLMQVGLSGLPGGGAEIFHPEIRAKIAPRKESAEVWLNVHQTAHKIGLPTNATMLFGHVESPEHRVQHLLTLYDAQADAILHRHSARFEAFVPLVFHPRGTRFPDIVPADEEDILRTVAVSRIVLSNIPHIKAYWVSLGVELAQRALHYGADDFDGTVQQERIHHDAGSESPVGLHAGQLKTLIDAAGRVPVERDSHYNVKER